jgi:hypothetical protein
MDQDKIKVHSYSLYFFFFEFVLLLYNFGSPLILLINNTSLSIKVAEHAPSEKLLTQHAPSLRGGPPHCVFTTSFLKLVYHNLVFEVLDVISTFIDDFISTFTSEKVILGFRFLQ